VKQDLPEAVYIDGTWYRASGPGSLAAFVLWYAVKFALLIGIILVCQNVGGWIGGLVWRIFS